MLYVFIPIFIPSPFYSLQSESNALRNTHQTLGSARLCRLTGESFYRCRAPGIRSYGLQKPICTRSWPPVRLRPLSQSVRPSNPTPLLCPPLPHRSLQVLEISSTCSVISAVTTRLISLDSLSVWATVLSLGFKATLPTIEAVAIFIDPIHMAKLTIEITAMANLKT